MLFSIWIMKNLDSVLFEIAAALKSGKTAIFCGAGISYNSGLPIVPNLLTYIFHTLGLSNSEADLLKKSSLPFEKIMEIIPYPSHGNDSNMP